MTDLICLFLFCVFYAQHDAIMDSIKDYRTNLAMHPYRDFWHLSKHAARISLFFAGIMFGASWVNMTTETLAVIVFAIIVGKIVWNAVYKESKRWMEIDESLKITTKIKWLDKLLGFHW